MRFFLLLISFSFCSFSQAQSQTNFSQVSIELDVGQSLPLSNKVSFDVQVADTEGLVNVLNSWKNVTAQSIDNESLRVSLIGPPVFSNESKEQYLANTFVVDIEEESIKEFVSVFNENVNKPLDLLELTKFVNSYISEPTYVNSFNIASVVADQRSGDCTEYAVLSTALARSLGIPSKVVFGSVILEGEDRVIAYGHAWSEVFIDEQWQILDAALYGAQAKQSFYFPVGELSNEGPGFSLSVFELVSRLPIKISRLKNL